MMSQKLDNGITTQHYKVYFLYTHHAGLFTYLKDLTIWVFFKDFSYLICERYLLLTKVALLFIIP